MLAQLGLTVMSLLIGAAGGAVFAVIGIPLPWTLGAIAASAIAAVFGNRWPMPPVMRHVARPVVGVLAGSAFTPAIIGAMLGWWPSLPTVAVYSLAISAVGYLVFTRRLRFDPVTAYFAATPGGLGEFTLLGGMLGGRTHTLVLIHAIRVLTIVFGIPVILQLAQTPIPSANALGGADAGLAVRDWVILIGCGVAGYLLGRIRGFPGGTIVASMLVSAVLHAAGATSAVPPGWLVAIVQVLIGSIAGARFAGITWADARRDVAVALGWAGALLGVTVMVAAITTPLLGMPFTTLLLALAPGGVSEMIILSYALQADVAFVAFCQALRIFLVLAFAPFFFNLLARRRSRD